MARVRYLNFSEQTAGTSTTGPVPPGIAAAWDLETDLEPRFTPRSTIQLLPMSVLALPPKAVPRGWSALVEIRFIRPKPAALMPFTSFHPHLPYVLATTNALTPNGSSSLFFAAVPAAIVVGMTVINLTDPTVIPAGTTVTSKTATNVGLSAAVTGAGVPAGELIRFSY